MFNFDFLENGLGIVSPLYFIDDFLRKIFVVLNSIKWSNFIAWLSLLLDVLDNMCIDVVCFHGCDAIILKSVWSF